ncbi:copper resistance CopC/CopD family protein [Rhizobium sp. Leaf341]|uniref:copper resistance CopC/CopD family protein n=1 Tax=Rhizobium sp. Leaf341 TaxID=1736344 RepID=UPI0007162F1C|nr:copper resistance protein CopC [Rhizobium sp. Leaf341]KQR69361.1 hypothetical protein ASG03_09305 [Rhizobium sp. Leaf341]
MKQGVIGTMRAGRFCGTRGHRPSPWHTGLLALLLLPMLLLAGTGQALAHAQLISSDPADGAHLAASPREIVLTFSEPVDPLVFRLSDPTGQMKVLSAAAPGVASGQAATRLVVALPSDVAVGAYSLSWRVTSADGHPIGGGLVFSIGDAGGFAARAPAADERVASQDTVTKAGLWMARLIVIAGLVFGVGGAGWAALLSRRNAVSADAGGDAPAAPALVALSLWLGLAATPVWIVFQGYDVLGDVPDGWVSPAVWSAGLGGTAYGRAAILCSVAIITAIVSLRMRRRGVRLALAGLAFVLAGLSAAVAGHAATAPPRFATIPGIVLHMFGAMAWIGGLAPLWAALGASRLGTSLSDPDGAALRRFSRLIPFVLAILVGSGLLLATVQVQAVSNLWTTAYGQVLLAKLALVLLLLVLATVNRFLWTRTAIEGHPRALRRLRRSILAEIVLGAMVLAVLGLWRFTPPPRALAVSAPSVQAQKGTPQDAQQREVREQGLMATVSVTPARTGLVRVSITGLMLDTQPIDPLSVTVDVADPGRELGPFVRQAQRAADGRFQADGFLLPVAGAWTVRVTVLVDDFTALTMTAPFDIAAE